MRGEAGAPAGRHRMLHHDPLRQYRTWQTYVIETEHVEEVGAVELGNVRRGLTPRRPA
jgi:hypothetical protein